MGRSAADGNHMPAGLTSPSQSLPKGGGDEDKRKEQEMEGKGRRGKQNREVRGARRDGGAMRKWRGRKHQMSVIDVWHNTCAQYAGRLLAGFPDLYSPEVRETAGLKQVFQLLNESQWMCSVLHIWNFNKADTTEQRSRLIS